MRPTETLCHQRGDHRQRHKKLRAGRLPIRRWREKWRRCLHRDFEQPGTGTHVKRSSTGPRVRVDTTTSGPIGEAFYDRSCQTCTPMNNECHGPGMQKRHCFKHDWLSDDFGSRIPVIQKKKRGKNATSIVERVTRSYLV